MKEFMEYLVGRLVDEPDAVEVVEERDADCVTFTIHVAQPDIGKVIGRRGRIIDAVRLVARGATARSGGRVVVDVAD